MKYRFASFGFLAWAAALLVVQSCGGGAQQPPFEVSYEGIVIRLASDSESRKPFLRVDVTIYYAAELGADELVVARLTGAEGKDAAIRGLGNMPPVEEVEGDQNFAQDTAEEQIKESFTNQGLPAPQKVKFSSFVIQG
jgi:hypothetical protein